ncbi:MAG: hypothetical protein PHD10_00725 [Bacilli bacterium]|nr:hypothetical protein [Bacilli bacterium]MDD4607645.1 hypothetical protein [Bacilli bacterium]
MRFKSVIGLLSLAIISVLLSGCQAEYDLVIDSKNGVSETLKVTIPNEKILNNNDDIDLFLDNRIKSYKNVNAYKDYKYKKHVGKNESYLIMSKDYKTLKSYSNSRFRSNLFEKLTIVENDKYNIFKTTGRFYYEYLYGGEPTDPSYQDAEEGSPTQVKIGEVEISIKLHNKLIETNADITDEDNNIYTWKITPDQKEKFIYLKYSNSLRYDVMIKDFISNNIITIVLISSIILVILVTSGVISIKHVRNNKI